ncbi:MAG: molybdopterin-guanine dinucleotide biosynthesis protein B [Anaerolineae bacterium]
MAVPIISIVGWHNSGKTTFLERFIVALKRRGLRIATVKHSREGFELDREGTDTWRYARAGSDVVAISAGRHMALLQQAETELTLDDVLARMPADLDLVVVEGYKSLPLPKIEVIGAATPEGRIASPAELLALVSADPDAVEDEGVPTFAPDDAEGVADYLEALGLLSGREAGSSADGKS